MNAHTPGPWVFNVETNTVEDSEGVPVCSLPTLEAESSYEQVILADAALIRTSPEMLSALRLVLADPTCLKLRHETSRSVLAAIAKAEGKS